MYKKYTMLTELVFHLLDFGVLEKDSINQIRSLLSMYCLLLGYSFELGLNSPALGTTGSVKTMNVTTVN